MSKIEIGGYKFFDLALTVGDEFYGYEFGHMFLRYTDDNNNMWVIRAGSNPSETGLSLNFEINEPWSESFDGPKHEPYDLSEYSFLSINLDGRDPEHVWQVMIEAAQSIDRNDELYLAFWTNCIAVVRSALNAVGVDSTPYESYIKVTTGGTYPNLSGVVNAPYELGLRLLGVKSDDILRGNTEKDLFFGTEGFDEIFGYSFDGEGISDHRDEIFYQTVQGSVTLSLNLDPNAQSLVTKDSGQDVLHGIEKYNLTTENDTLVVAADVTGNDNVPIRYVDMLHGINTIDVSLVAEDYRLNFQQLEDQIIQRRNAALAPIKVANAQLIRTGLGDDDILTPNYRYTFEGCRPARS